MWTIYKAAYCSIILKKVNILRLYSFVNFYLNSISQGIQTAHLVHDLFLKYESNSAPKNVLHDWANNHKTIIVLNGGMNSDILAKAEQLLDLGVALGLPQAYFREDSNSLGDLMTCCGIVCPSWVYDAKSFTPELGKKGYVTQVNGIESIILDSNSPSYKLIELVKSCPLAR